MSEWRQTTIGEISQIFDGPHATPTKTESGPWFLSISSLENGRLNLAESAHLSESDFNHWTRRVTPQEGDLLFSYETKLGSAALMPGGLQACLGRRMALLRPERDSVDPRFLLYCYLAPGFQYVIKQRSIHGATVDRIPLSELGEWPIFMPSLREQEKIGSALGTLDDKIENCSNISSTSRALGDAHFSAVLSTENGQPASFGQLASEGNCEFGDGYRTKRDEHGRPGLPILRVAEVLDGIISPSFDDFVHNDYRQAMGAKISRARDVVVTTKGTVGRVAMIPDGSSKFVYSPQVCYFRVPQGGNLSPEFLFYWFRSEYFWSQARSRKSQTDMADYINLADLRSMVVTVPTGDVNSALKARLSALEGVAQQAIKESVKLAEIRDSLLPKLMSGEIRVRDAEKIVEDVT